MGGGESDIWPENDSVKYITPEKGIGEKRELHPTKGKGLGGKLQACADQKGG